MIPYFSIVVPVYNKCSSLSRCLASVEANASASFEVILVDDGSTDGSRDFLESVSSRYTVISQDNSGPSVARNRGVENARGQVLLFLDADDELMPDSLSAHRAAYDDPAVEATVGSSFFSHSDRSWTIVPYDSFPEIDDGEGIRKIRTFSAKLIKGVAVNCFTVRRDVFQTLGGFNERMRCWEITEFLFRLLLAVNAVAILQTVVCHVFVNNQNSTFVRMRRDPESVIVLLSCFEKHLDDLPATERGAVEKLIASFLTELLVLGELIQFKSFARRMRIGSLFSHFGWREVTLAILPHRIGAPLRRRFYRIEDA